MNFVRVQSDGRGKRMLFDEPGLIGSGGNSGFQGVNLVAQFGLSKIILIGFDMHDGGGLHWHADHPGSNPNSSRFARWRAQMDDAAETLARLGIEVVNASDVSALTAYKREPIERTLERWEL